MLLEQYRTYFNIKYLDIKKNNNYNNVLKNYI